MRNKYSVSGPHSGTTYPEWEVIETDSRGDGYVIAYLHSQEHAELLAEALNKKRKR